MIRIYDIRIPAGNPEICDKKLRETLGALAPGASVTIVRRSLDARKKEKIMYLYSADIRLPAGQSEKKWIAAHKKLKAETAAPVRYIFPETQADAEPLALRPLVVGMGPAGLFAALVLARAGYRPLLLEQGAPVEERQRDVASFWNGGSLKPWSNVQFGEGGAGTFSDGKLNTGIKDPSGRIPFVLQTFAQAGASPDICYDAKPHIGTDVLARVVKNLREEIIRKGGTVLFHTRLKDIRTENGRLKAVFTENTESGDITEIPAQLMILAPGHSARETFPMLIERGVEMEKKAFAVGLRIQHPQKMIDRIQYGEAVSELPPADYKLTAKAGDGRGVYSFCMCPGGKVVNASSEEGALCVNGMSEAARDSKNANAALIVQVGPEDFSGEDVLAGVAFQRQLEKTAYKLAGGKIPVQLWKDFEAGIPSEMLGSVEPEFGGLWAFADLTKDFPPYLRKALLDAMPQFDRKMPGYADPDALLAGIEARTSSPVRMLRNEAGESTVAGLYPCGEGAGYAGGITSAAVDGLKIAEQIIRRFRRPES